MSNSIGSNRLPTALELFEEHRQKFQEIELVPRGFNADDQNTSRFYFELRRPGGAYIQQFGKSTPSFHLKTAKMGFNFTFDPEGQYGVLAQLTCCIADEIRNRFLVGRKFMILPHPLYPITSLSSEHPYVVDVGGEPIPGFYSGEGGGLCCAWVDFIPKDTPERAQIQAARDYEAARSEAVSGAIAICKEKEKMDWFQKLLPPKQRPA